MILVLKQVKCWLALSDGYICAIILVNILQLMLSEHSPIKYQISVTFDVRLL